MEKNFQPVILLGAPRSGTTLLATILESHKDICVWKEPNVIWRYGNEKVKNDFFTVNMFSTRKQRYIQDKFETYLQNSNKTIFVEKTPPNCLRLPYINRIFPNAKYIHIVRNGCDVVKSIARQYSLGEDNNHKSLKTRQAQD